jgi:general L-amino acid transport system substrate-binding protein
MRVSFLALSLAAALAAPACAGPRLSEIKSRGHLACAAFARPGLAREAENGAPSSGLFADLCQAVAAAALGPDAKSEFSTLELPRDAEDLAKDAFDVLFLTEGEIVNASLSGKLAPGPTAFYETFRLLVPLDSPAAGPEDLAGKPVCFHEQADHAALALDEFFDRKKLEYIHTGFQEDVEMVDSYNVRHCVAVVSESTDLAAIRLRKGVLKFESRLLPEPLGVTPILTLTPMSDPLWSAAVSWVAQFEIAAERTQTKWRPGGANVMTIDGAPFGLAAGWRENVLAKVGDYGAIYARNLGEGSPLKLPRGANALWSAGGLFAPPVAEGAAPPY